MICLKKKTIFLLKCIEMLKVEFKKIKGKWRGFLFYRDELIRSTEHYDLISKAKIELRNYLTLVKDEYMDKGPRTVFDWGNGVELVFEPDCEDSVTMKIYLLESKWGEDKRPFDLNLKFNKLSRIYGVNGSQIGSGIILSEN